MKPKDGKYDIINRKVQGKELTGKNWSFNPKKDVDWRGNGSTYLDGLEEAFKRTGLKKEGFRIVKWGKTQEGKTIPVEWEGLDGAQVNMDIPDWNNVNEGGTLGEGPHQPHIGYQNSGKGKNRVRGHVVVDYVPATR